MRPFRYPLLVAFQDTNLVGNVYFAHYFAWQGKCRESFLSQHAPQILEDFKAGFGMITREAECRFVREARAFDQIVIEMFLEDLSPLGVRMRFDYYRQEGSERVLVAEGSQSTMWVNPQHRPSMMPQYLYRAIKDFAEAEDTPREAGSEPAPGPASA